MITEGKDLTAKVKNPSATGKLKSLDEKFNLFKKMSTKAVKVSKRDLIAAEELIEAEKEQEKEMQRLR